MSVIRKAKLLSYTVDNMKIAADAIRRGELVAFPTETVYGLGADATHETAVRNIFKVKGRPLTDPLIVHVKSPEHALTYIDVPDRTKNLFKYLSSQFWPGPLTLVAKAKDTLPLALSAGTGCIGFRMPNHPIALQLIELSDRPIAAPSANKFNHISPTTAEHVMNDLGESDIHIIDGGKTGCDCTIGIESTVAKIDLDNNQIIVYRRGGISEFALRKALDDINEKSIKINCIENKVDNATDEGQTAPGQMVKHYAPKQETYLVKYPSEMNKDNNNIVIDFDLDKTLLIDFNHHFGELKEKVKVYKDLSEVGSCKEGAHVFFNLLRECEKIDGIDKILLCDIQYKNEDEFMPALYDRMFRSASGKQLIYKDGNFYNL